MRRTLLIVLVFLAFSSATPKPKAPPKMKALLPVQPRVLTCADTDNTGWRGEGGSSFDVEVDYEATGSCKASIVGVKKDGTQIPHDPITAADGLKKADPLPGVASIMFKCEQSGGGQCRFRIRKSITTGKTPASDFQAEPSPTVNCGSKDKVIFDMPGKSCDVLVRVEAPDGCEARVTQVSPGTGPTPYVSHSDPKFFSFSGVSKLEADCRGNPSSVKKCKFEVRAWF